MKNFQNNEFITINTSYGEYFRANLVKSSKMSKFFGKYTFFEFSLC